MSGEGDGVGWGGGSRFVRLRYELQIELDFMVQRKYAS